MARKRIVELSESADRRALVLLREALERRRGTDTLASLLKHCFTRAERAMLVRRLEVAARLLGGQSYRMIQEALRVSPNLIRRVDRWLSSEQPGYRKLITLRRRVRRRQSTGHRSARGRIPGTFDAFLGRFPIWRDL